MDLFERAANVPEAVRLLITGERGPALAVPVPVPSSALALVYDKLHR